MSISSVDQLAQILDKGDISPLCSCCPCGNLYAFASVETFLKLAEALGWTNDQGCPSWYSDCCTENCLDKLGELYGPALTDVILDKGIIEYSLLGTKSTLCDIYDYLKENNVPIQDAIDFVDMILDKGVVFYCTSSNPDIEGDQQVLASVETFLKYGEAVGIGCVDPSNCGCLPTEKCCLSIKASVETYLKFAEAVGSSGPGPIPA
jgi:hypothetical protein